MENSKTEILESLQKKKDILSKVLEMTAERKFFVTEDDVERFINFYSKRQNYFDSINKIDYHIKKRITAELMADSVFVSEKTKKEAEIKEIAKQIKSFDEKNKVIMQALMADIKSKLKGVKNQKKVKKTYYDDYTYGYSGRTFFDRKS